VEIISHRGYWTGTAEKNTAGSFHRSFASGFGTETDIRDAAGKIVISHDPGSETDLELAEFLAIHASYNRSLPLALNVKADGLQALLKAEILRASPQDYFVFDMSVPDMLHYFELGVPVFTRQSDIEPSPVCYKEAAGVWLDTMRDDWLRAEHLNKIIGDGKRVCVVSPELHGRSHLEMWERLKDWGVQEQQQVILCTDLPDDAQHFFNI